MSTSEFATAYFPAAKQSQKHAANCCCAACLGLECLDRPRFFAGQLLSEADLNSAQAYVMAKNRLHNRYLHGPGVVCGLEVVCNDCDGYVTIKPGYAIDPCGNDIVVCQEQSFDVIGAIRKCSQGRKKQRRGDCQPYTPAPDPGCKDVEEHYCITIAYDEKDTRPITALRQDKSQSGGCGCGGGNGHGTSKHGGCGCQSQQSSSTQTSTTTASSSQTLGACEPTRTLESFRLSVIEEPENQCGTLSERLQDTLLYRIVNCIKTLGNFLGKRVSKTDQATLYNLLLAKPGNAAGANVSSESVQAACCRLRQAILDLYIKNPFNVRCAMLKTLDQIVCPTPNPNEIAVEYQKRATVAIYQLVAALLQYVIDCICHQLLPPCSTDPCDDRLILACVTIKNCKIIRICNLSCRQFAGGFPSMNYWLSIIPIVPLLAYLVKTLCCRPDMVRANSPLVNDLENILKVVDPTGSLRQAIFAGNFALPKMYAGKVSQLREQLTAAGISATLQSQGTNLATMVGKPPEQVRSALEGSGIHVVDQPVETAAHVPVLETLASSPFAAEGDTVVVYRTANAVVGFRRAGAQEEVAAKQSDVEALRKQVIALQQQVKRLKKR